MMTGLGEIRGNSNSGPARHIPVLLEPVVKAVEPGADQTIVDGTFGAGGYSRRFLDAGARVIGIDRDPEAIGSGQDLMVRYDGRLKLVSGRFSKLDQIVGPRVDAVVLDIGVSSMQLDQGHRGFSFQSDGPLDMRMSQSGPDASDVVNGMGLGQLARIFGLLGEEPQAARVARSIVERRQEARFETTADLSRHVERVLGKRGHQKIHPATRVFQALRMFINDELGELARGLSAAERVLKPGGRLVVVSFHSLEDRVVKRFFAQRSGVLQGSRHLPAVESAPQTFVASRKAIVADAQEIASNPRSRSAKLRVGTRRDGAPVELDMKELGIKPMPDIKGLISR